MSDPIPLTRSFIPYQQRESAKVGFGDYAWKIAKFFLITKIGAMIGGGIGYATFTKDRKVGAQLGYFLAGIATGTYEAWKHWQPIKGTQERFTQLLPAVTEELNPDILKEEMKLQQEIQEGVGKRQELLQKLMEKRKSAIMPRGKAVDALAKETQSAEITYPGRS